MRCRRLRRFPGGPAPSSTFTNLVTGEVVTRDAREGCVPDEFVDKTTNDVGALSMANTGQPHIGGSQFFINTAHNDFLDHWRSDVSPSQHPVFGRAVEGADIVEAIERAPSLCAAALVACVTARTLTVQLRLCVAQSGHPRLQTVQNVRGPCYRSREGSWLVAWSSRYGRARVLGPTFA